MEQKEEEKTASSKVESIASGNSEILKNELPKIDAKPKAAVTSNDVVVVDESKFEKPSQLKSNGNPMENEVTKKRPALAAAKNPYKKARASVVKTPPPVKSTTMAEPYDVISDIELLQIDLDKATEEACKKYRDQVYRPHIRKMIIDIEAELKKPPVIDLTEVSKN